MTTSTGLLQQVQHIGQLVAGHEVATADAARAGNQRSWAILGAIYDLGIDCRDPENADEFEAELARRAVPPPGEGDNYWSAVIHLATDFPDPMGGTVNYLGRAQPKWLANKTYANYSGGLRALDEMQTGRGDAPSAIESFSNPACGKNFHGLRKSDRLKHAQSGSTSPDYSDEEVLAKAEDIEANDCAQLDIPADAKFVLVWCRVDGGVAVPGGVVDGGEAAAAKAASALT